MHAKQHTAARVRTCCGARDPELVAREIARTVAASVRIASTLCYGSTCTRRAGPLARRRARPRALRARARDDRMTEPSCAYEFRCPRYVRSSRGSRLALVLALEFSAMTSDAPYRRLDHLALAIGIRPASAKEQTGSQRRVIAAQGGATLACIAPDGSCEWSMAIGQCHDLFVLPSGNILTQDGWARVIEYSSDRSEIVCASHHRQLLHGLLILDDQLQKLMTAYACAMGCTVCRGV